MIGSNSEKSSADPKQNSFNKNNDRIGNNTKDRTKTPWEMPAIVVLFEPKKG